MPLTQPQLDVDGNLVDVAYEITTNPANAVYITRGGKLVEYPSAKGEVTAFDATGKPADSYGNDGDQRVVPHGHALAGMVFQKAKGTWAYVTQSFTPFLNTAPTTAIVAAALPVDERYWYYLFGQFNVLNNGFYFVTADGVLAGPYTDGPVSSSGGAGSLGELTDVDAADFTPGYVLTRLANGTFSLQPGSGALTQGGWSIPPNLVGDKVFDTDTVTLQELADVVGTMIQNLIAATVFSN